ncbi:GNAT family N-acyltransferase [Temperatibacter marinus]|uniref:L-ornithine N(alpha)-acyltransferase n=1 Tax=Temperatibacter marinus TaxID=1456591 RepID=A0AA52EKC3_9PROT|nr:GNAT family N-acyltransferase [Temperatibacter marinus]WND04122.1 GNAT family N-acyltransferase [Temperatibacter marinus]
MMMKEYEKISGLSQEEILKSTPIYAQSGSLQVRLARSFNEIMQAQKLRYKIFYKEMQAKPSFLQKITLRDIDDYDRICDHLLVLDRGRPINKQVVGTYRLLPQKTAEAHSGFYSAGEYNLAGLVAHTQSTLKGKQLLELGRSCVHKDYRASSTISLLWQGISSFMRDQNIAYLFGCASFEGTDPGVHAEALSYLHYNHSVEQEIGVEVHQGMGVSMDLMTEEAIDVRRAKRAMPPLVRGYIRLGAKIGRGAYIDDQFGTTDVFILMDVNSISRRYSKHYNIGSAQNDTQ